MQSDNRCTLGLISLGPGGQESGKLHSQEFVGLGADKLLRQNRPLECDEKEPLKHEDHPPLIANRGLKALVPLHFILDLRAVLLLAACRGVKSDRLLGPATAADVNYSGKFLMRVPKRLHSELAHAAKAQGVSLNQYVLYLLTKGHGERGKRAA